MLQLMMLLTLPAYNLTDAFTITSADSGYYPGFNGTVVFDVNLSCTPESVHDLYVGDAINVSIYLISDVGRMLEFTDRFIYTPPKCDRNYKVYKQIHSEKIVYPNGEYRWVTPQNITIETCLKPAAWNFDNCFTEEHHPKTPLNTSLVNFSTKKHLIPKTVVPFTILTISCFLSAVAIAFKRALLSFLLFVAGVIAAFMTYNIL